MTYDAFAARLVAEHGLRLGFETDPTMISGATRYRLASRVVRVGGRPVRVHLPAPPRDGDRTGAPAGRRPAAASGRGAGLDPHAHAYLVELASAPLNRHGNVYADVKRAVAAAHERLELVSLVGDYQRLKQRLGVVEFADQMAIAARLALEVPGVGDPARRPSRWCCSMSTKTPPQPRRCCCAGCSPGTPSEGLGHPVTAVGDPFQAIYGWRGAAASNIIAFAGDFRTSTRPARRFALTVNRRSGQRILDVANTLSAPLRADTSSLLGSARLRVGQTPGWTSWSHPTARQRGRSGPRCTSAGPRRCAGSLTRWCRRTATARRPTGRTSPCSPDATPTSARSTAS